MANPMTALAIPLLDTLFVQLPRLQWDASELHEHRRLELTATVAFAKAESRWHAARFEYLDVNALDPSDLSGLPTMTKRDLMANWDDVVTDRRLTLAGAREHLREVERQGFEPYLGEYLVFTTGGSTGVPAVFPWSAVEMARWGASSVRWSAIDGAGPPARHAWVGARSHRHPSAVASMLSGGDESLSVPIDQPLAQIVARLNEINPDSISVVCSMLPSLLDAADRDELNIRPARLAVFGDVLDPRCHDRARSVFGVDLVEGYPTTDVGYIAQQAAGEAGLYVNDDLMIVEVVDEFDRPVAPGEPSDHLLVTSLHQRTLPLIRYRIDDRVTMASEPGRFAAYSRIVAIDGRSDDVFRYGDRLVHPYVFRTVLSAHIDVRDYVVRQTERGAEVDVVIDRATDLDALRVDLVRALNEAGLDCPSVNVTATERLERTAVGKRLRFIPMT
jgi:phenylacetate-CoA ligase